jgi:Tol biopolymer transport system component
MPILTATWRPPLGSEILVMDADDGTAKNASGAMSLVSAESGLPIQTILERIYARWRGHPMWSPDGSLISFGEWGDGDPDNGGLTVQTHVVATDGSVNRVLPAATGVQWQAPESWSNDGTRLLVIRGYAPDHSGARPVAIPVDGSGTGVEIDWPSTTMSPTDAFAWEWAPDDSSILGTPANDDGGYLDQVLLDPVAGTSRTLAWSSNSLPSWQRKAP